MRNAILILSLSISSIHASPISIAYFAAHHEIQVLQNETVSTWAAGSGDESVLAVNGEISVAASFESGSKFSLSGEILADEFPALEGNFLDGTTDGISNYAVTHHFNGGMVFKFDANWSNKTILFNTGHHDDLGITYDNSNNTLWISSHRGTDRDLTNSIRNYDMAGNELFSFDINNLGSSHWGLALDHLDNTLWISDDGRMLQFSKTGELLSDYSYDGYVHGHGMEFDFATTNSVPEPSTFVLIIVSLFIIGFRKRYLSIGMK